MGLPNNSSYLEAIVVKEKVLFKTFFWYQFLKSGLLLNRIIVIKNIIDVISNLESFLNKDNHHLILWKTF